MRMVRIWVLLGLSLLAACGSGEVAGGTTVETTNGLAVRVETTELRLDSAVANFAWRVPGAVARARRWCVLGGGDTLAYVLRGADVWVRVPELAANSAVDLALWPDTLRVCPQADSVAVLGADAGYAAWLDWGGAAFSGVTQGRVLGAVYEEPQAYTLSAEMLLDSGLMGGEVLTVGNTVGLRMDHLGARAALYGYASFAGPSNWSVISGDTPIGDSTWIRVDLVVDVAAGRFEVYFDGVLHYASPEALAAISYDKLGTQIMLGQNAAGAGDYFQGRLGVVSVATVARSADWIRLAARQGRTGAGWNWTEQ